MATNVLSRSVFSGGGVNLELYSYVLQTDSGDAALLQFVNEEEVTLTATAGDIRTGMTAITDDGVITGTFAGVDTSDANAVAEDILLGKTAYVNNEKIEGTLIAVDTSDATATAGDIRSGVTAYVNGELVTGTWVPTLVTKSDTKSYAPGRGTIEAHGTYDVTFNFGDVNITGTPTGSTSGVNVVFNSVVSVNGGNVTLRFKNNSNLATGIKKVTFYCTASYSAIE